jgi:hypothetical protein
LNSVSVQSSLPPQDPNSPLSAQISIFVEDKGPLLTIELDPTSNRATWRGISPFAIILD